MNRRAFNLMKASGSGLTVAVLLTGSGCVGAAPEDLTAIAAVLNRTEGPLTVTLTDPPATDVLEADEAIFYEVRQSITAREFVFESGEATAQGSLWIVAAGELPGFATGLATVSLDDDEELLVVDASVDRFAPLARATGSLPAGSSVFLFVNDSPNTVGIEGPGGATTRQPSEHTAIILEEATTLAITIVMDDTDLPDLVHVVEAPPSEDGETAAFLAFITSGADGTTVETQRARFRHLE